MQLNKFRVLLTKGWKADTKLIVFDKGYVKVANRCGCSKSTQLFNRALINIL